MKTFEDITAANTAVMQYVLGPGQALDAELRDKLVAMTMSPSKVDVFVNAAELLYARSAEVDDAGKSLAGGLAAFCAINGWHGLGDGDLRGGKIAQAMRRELGETPPQGYQWPAPADDPMPRTEYAKPVEPAAAQAAG